MVCLLSSHIIGDFLIRVKLDESRIRQSIIISIYAGTVASWGYIICGAWRLWEIPLLVLSTHIIIYCIERFLGRDDIQRFLTFQVIYLSIIVLIALVIASSQIPIRLFWFDHFGSSYLKFLVFFSGLIATIFGGNIFIGKIVKPFIPQIEKEASKFRRSVRIQGIGGLKGGGQLIGEMERTLIFLFIMIDQPAALGFLITAKSILRFGEIKDYHQRMLAEYIIIGTMASFAFGIAVSYLTKYLMDIVR